MNADASLFGTVPGTNYLGLLGPEPDWKKTADFLAFRKEEVAAATGVPKDSVRFDDRITSELRERLTEIATICELVAQHFGGDIPKTALWFQLSNPLLGNLTPRDMVRLGRYRKVLKFVLSARQAEEKARST